MVSWCAIAACFALLTCATAEESQSRFQYRKRNRNADLAPAQQAEVDDMVNNLLHWIQGLYQEKSRKARQYYGGKPEKPRPFEPASYLPPIGYPQAGSRPTPSYEEGPSSTTSNSLQNQSFQSIEPTYQAPNQTPYQPPDNSPTYQPSQPSYTSQQPQPSFKPGQPEQNFQPIQPTYQTGQPTYQTSQPSEPSYQPSQPSYQPGQPSYQPSQPSYQPSQPSYQPSQPSYKPSQPNQPNSETEVNIAPAAPEETTQTIFQQQEVPQSPEVPQNNADILPLPSGDDQDRHPPHIHAITVDCGKDMMTINIEFNKPYNGIIYSQDHYNEQECVYVRENSNQVKYSFTVSLNKCGTKFFSDFENEGQAYLENVLVLQNEPGIQEVWDHVRRVRCLWEGNLTKQLVSSLSVGMLNQITSNFSGDTAMARLDIQVGKGPFAQEANGLIKIGEIMTLVVSVTGDAGFDILVRECIARDADSKHVVPLTDSNGCILKPKLFGAFQKTRETRNTGASIIAYAYFNAFKFPDEMDLIIQCDVELCKTDCEVCPNPGSYEPKRKRRDIIHIGNKTDEPMTTIGKSMRVVFAEDLPSLPTGFCMSPAAALWGGTLVLLGSLMSSVIVSFCWQRSRGSAKFS